MAILKRLEDKYPKDYRIAFEDLATLMFCTDIGRDKGVIRRTNQKGIESDPVIVDNKIYAYQAKYYKESTQLSKHKKDLIDSINQAATQKVTDLYFFINKDKPDKNPKTNKEAKYIQEIEDAAERSGIKLHWWTLSVIESSLDLEKYKVVNDKYFGDIDSEDADYTAFYDYIYKQFSNDSGNALYGNMSLHDCYIEPTINIGKSKLYVRDYLASWVCGQETIAVISGEPGHGKTSICRKAMCDFHKKGWLSGIVQNVFCFSLNPASTTAVVNNSFYLDRLLSWGRNRTDPLCTVKLFDCKNALIFFDGFDELVEWYPRFSLEEFIESEIMPFQEETGAHIVITSRKMAIESDTKEYLLQDGTNIPVNELQLISKEQQINWINIYIEHTQDSSPDKAHLLREYLNDYRKLKDDGELQEILGIPIIFRMIVEARYLPETKESIVHIYDQLFHITCNRHIRQIRTKEDELSTKEKLRNHAYRIYIDDNESAETNVSVHSAWLFSFYTTHKGYKRVGFLHKSFYDYFLADYIYYSLKNCDDEKKIISFLKLLSRRKLDSYTIKYIYERNLTEETVIYEIISSIVSYVEQVEAISVPVLGAKWAQLVGHVKLSKNVIENLTGIISAVCKSFSYSQKFCDLLSSYPVAGIVVSNSLISNINVDFSDRKLNNAFFYFGSFDAINANSSEWKHTNFDNAKMREAVFTNSNLTGSSFSHANMIDINLTNADLTNANLYRTRLRNGIMRDANMVEANLRKANLQCADLTNADLTNANLNYANLNRAILEGSILKGAKLKQVRMKGVVLENIDLTDIDFTGSNLQRLIITNVNFYRVNFSGCDLRGSIISDSSFSNSILDSADLRYVKFERVKFQNVSIKTAKLTYSVWDNTTLKIGDLSNSLFRDAIVKTSTFYLIECLRTEFRKVLFNDSCFNSSSFPRALFSYCTFNNLEFLHADLSFMKFSNNAIDSFSLRSCNVEGTVIRNMNISKIKHVDTNFGEAIIKEPLNTYDV